MNIWSLLITIIIAIALWMTAFPGINLKNPKSNVGAEQKAIKQAKQVESETIQQVNQARQIQQQEQNNFNNNNQ